VDDVPDQLVSASVRNYAVAADADGGQSTAGEKSMVRPARQVVWGGAAPEAAREFRSADPVAEVESAA
jgi:hypothetical protein